MSEVEQLVVRTKELLGQSSPEDALELLSQYIKNESYINNVKYLNILGETLLENSQVEEAYNIYTRSVDLDPKGEVSVDGFFNIGQIVGGSDGLQYIMKGCDIISNRQTEGKQVDEQFSMKKLIQGIFSQIEIWMTDLCMESEAESQCEKLIAKALELDQNNPESWSLLASIKISQQKPEEAKQFISKSWDLFSEKKKQLEDSADAKLNNPDDADFTDANAEYIELIQPLLTLAKFSVEVGLFDLAATISANIHDISDDLLEPFYVEAFSNYLAAKSLQYDLQNNNGGQEDFYQRLESINNVKLNLNEQGEGATQEITDYVNSALVALLNGSRVIYADETADPEVKEQVKVLTDELGGKTALKRVEKANKTEGADVNEDNWEDEIEES